MRDYKQREKYLYGIRNKNYKNKNEERQKEGQQLE